MLQLDDYLVNVAQKLAAQEFYPYQAYTAKRLFASLVLGDMKEFALEWARQKGKTTTGERVIKTGLMMLPELAKVGHVTDVYPQLRKFKDGFRVAFVGPTEYQAKIPFVRIKENISKFKPWLTDAGIRVEACSNQCIYLSNGSMAEAHTAKTGSTKEGGTYHLIWKTEAQEITAYAQQKVFAPMLAATGGLPVSDGTPGNVRSVFYNLIQTLKRSRPKNYIRIDCNDYPEHPDTYKAWLAEFTESLPGGVDNDAFKVSCLLEWLSDTGMLIDFESFKRCYADGLEGRPKFNWGDIDRKLRHRYYAGIDRGKVHDKTVAHLIEQWTDHYRLVDMIELDLNISHDTQNEILCGWFRDKELPNLRIVPDSTGAGDPNTDYMIRMLSGYAEVMGLYFTVQAKDAMYKIFNKAVPAPGEKRPSKLYWPMDSSNNKAHRNFEIQMLDCILEKRGNYYNFKHPDKKADTDLGIEPHDDHVDALMLALFAAEGIYA